MAMLMIMVKKMVEMEQRDRF